MENKWCKLHKIKSWLFEKKIGKPLINIKRHIIIVYKDICMVTHMFPIISLG